MLRFRDIRDAKAAGSYYGKSDGGYYLDDSGLKREVGGKAAKLLGLDAKPNFEQFERLLNGLDPHTGKQLTAKLIDGRIAGWDLTASVPKGVTIALEQGDSRIHDIIWEAGRETMADIEAMATTRERVAGAQADRVAGNMAWFAFEHPETRPAKEDNMPDPDRHIHFVVPNVCFDAVEEKWKALKFRPIYDLRKYFDRSFDLRLSTKLAELGYEIETKWKPDEKGGRKYFSWDVAGIPETVVRKFSRRTNEVEKLAKELGVEDAVSKDKLGATSRAQKRDDMTLEDYRKYWLSRITPAEGMEISGTVQRAEQGLNPKTEHKVDKAVAWAMEHHFERQSVMKVTDLAITAMERSLGGGLPEQVEAAAKQRGLLVKNGECTTQDVLDQERRIIQYALQGRGTCVPMGDGEPVIAPGSAITPTDEQRAIVRHIHRSTSKIMLIRGGAGTGKTEAMKWAIAGIDRPVVVLAPSSDASRNVLRRDGFKEAETVAMFLLNEAMQEKADHGVIWIDEAGQLPMKDLERVFAIAERVHARVVLQGDPKQHTSVERHGNMFHVLKEYAGLPVAELKGIMRQTGDYREAVAAIDAGNILKGHDIIEGLGWIHQVAKEDMWSRLVGECWEAMQKNESFIVVGITHKQNDAITEELRKRLRAEEHIGTEERLVECLKPLHWTDAQKGDLDHQYDGTEVVQLVKNSGAFRAGDRISVALLRASERPIPPKHFRVCAPAEITLSPGDVIRTMAGGWALDAQGKKHRIENGGKYTLKSFTKDGDLALANGWTIRSDFKHIGHGLVDTSFKAQGQTKMRVIAAMTEQSLPAINAKEFYVDLSRAKKKASIYTDLAPERLRTAIQRISVDKSATELMEPAMPKPKLRDKSRTFMQRVRDTYRQLLEKARDGIGEITRQREFDYAR